MRGSHATTSIKLLGLALLALVFGPVMQVHASECRWPGRDVLDAVLPVATDHGSHASGVVIGRDRVLTAAHAVQGGEQLFVRIGEHYRLAELLFSDVSQDLALLAVDTGSIAPLRLSHQTPEPNQTVWAVGFPRAGGMQTSSGVFRNMKQGALHTSAPIDSGQSGGGLLSCSQGRYELLGMLRGFGAYVRGSSYVRLENHSVAVAASNIEPLVTVYR